jgi:hypothetical protein
MKKTLALVFLLSLWAVASTAQTPATVEYDAFFKLDNQARIRLFNEVSAENRAALVREHIERWIEANRARLTPQQLEVMKANAAFATADKYRLPMTAEVRLEIGALEARSRAVFSPEELRQAMTIHGDHIPKK